MRKPNPAGAKLLRRFYKAHQGVRGTYEQAERNYAMRKQPRFRAGESQQHMGLIMLADALRGRA